jgi:DNA-binding CsgD family transcriptional regulator
MVRREPWPWPPQWSAAVAAAACAADPEPLLRPLLAQLGFDGLTSIQLSPGVDGRERALHLWSTAPSAWSSRYRQRNYAAADPRVTLTARRLSPVIWDGADANADEAVSRFLADAARFRVASGLAVSFRERAGSRAVVAFDSAHSPMPDALCASIAGRLGDLMLLAAALHERVLRPRFCNVADVPVARPCDLTARERECLRMAANGMTSGDIGGKLGIAERTVNFHMRNVLRKLDALNRPEAIAKALTRGVLQSGASAQRSV